jgi:hypothetical protein
MMRPLPGGYLLLAVALLCGCGYVGDPLPPALNIPEAIKDLRAVQRGDRILIDFTVPSLTTEGLPVRKLRGIDLRAGSAGTPFDVEQWMSNATPVPAQGNSGNVHVIAPAGAWYDREIVIGVRLLNDNGKPSDWSNMVTVAVAKPLAVPPAFTAAPHPKGIALAWRSVPGENVRFRIFRRSSKEKEPALLATVDTPGYLDTAVVLGERYEYSVQATAGTSESEPTPLEAVVATDVFRPAKPAGLTALVSLNSIELGWQRNPEEDLANYRIYRSEAGAPFVKLADADNPSFSDKKVTAGKTYRYAVTAIDQAGNESDRTDPVEAAAP